MKIRKGFVSNSSSSSFICEVCSNTQGGWDMVLNEAGMVECVNGHVFCESHMMAKDEKFAAALKEKMRSEFPEVMKITDIDELMKFAEENLYDYRYEIPAAACQICGLKVATDTDLIAYLLLKAGVSRKEAVDDIAATFQTYEAFKEGLK